MKYVFRLRAVGEKNTNRRQSIMNNPYTEETRWMLKRSLLEKIEQNPLMLNNSLMNTFYLNALNTALGELKQADDEKQFLYFIDSVSTDFFMQKKIQFEAYRLQMLSETEKLSIAIDSGWNIASIISNIEIIHENIAETLTEADSLQSIKDFERVIESDNLKGVYASVASAEMIESNEKIVNSIYLSTIGKEKFAFTAEQLADLVRISELCPLAGGSAVIKARSLRYLVDPKLYYHDRETCWSEGIQLRQQKKDLQSMYVKIYPNPANETATLEYSLATEKNGMMQIYSVTGQLFLTQSLRGSTGQHIFSTAGLMPGVYYINVQAGDLPKYNGKLIIIR